MNKLVLSILLGFVTLSAHAQSSWSFLQNKNLNAGIGIQSSDNSLSINYLKKEERNQLLLISKKDMDCLICNMQINFGNRGLNAEVEYLYKNANNEFIYGVLNKVSIVKAMSFNSSFTVKNLKNGNTYAFNGNVPLNFFNSDDFSEWQKKNDFYQTDSLNYYTGKGDSIVYATIGVSNRMSSIQMLSFKGVNLNCNSSCDIITYFAGGQATYKLTKEDNLGKITYRLPETFISDMKKYNRDKETFAIRVKSVERGDMIFKFDSYTYNPNSY